MPNDGNETFDMEHLLELAEEKKYRLLKEELVELNEVDIASFIEELDSERTVIVFRMLPKALARSRAVLRPTFGIPSANMKRSSSQSRLLSMAAIRLPAKRWRRCIAWARARPSRGSLPAVPS